MVLGGKLVADGTPCIVYGPNTREHAASLQERPLVLSTWQKTKIVVYNTGETDMVANTSLTEFPCSVLYAALLQPKKFILHAPYTNVNYPWRTSMFRCWYQLPVPSMNLPADPAHPMLLVFPTSNRSAQPILKAVSAPLVYYVRRIIRFWDCMGLSPESMQRAVLDEVSYTQNALPPYFKGELSLIAIGALMALAAAKAVDKAFEDTAKQAKKIEHQAMKQEAKQEAKQAAKVASLLKARGKRTSASSQSPRLMESPLFLRAPDEKLRHNKRWTSCC